LGGWETTGNNFRYFGLFWPTKAAIFHYLRLLIFWGQLLIYIIYRQFDVFEGAVGVAAPTIAACQLHFA